MANIETKFPDIEGTELISQSWTKLLTRDNSVRTQFAGTSFPEGLTEDDIGQPCFRTDEQKWYIFAGIVDEQPVWWNPFATLDATDISFIADDHFSTGSTTVDAALRFLAQRQLLNAVVFPPDSLSYDGDNTTTTFNLSAVATNKNLLNVYISGVKQYPDTYDLSENQDKIIFKQAPRFGEKILIEEYNSLLEYDISPVVEEFTSNGTDNYFDFSQFVYDKNMIEVNVDGKVLLKSEFSILNNRVTLNETPVAGTKVQIQTVAKGSILVPGDNTITEAKLADDAVTTSKLSDSSITNSKIVENSVTGDKIAGGSISLTKMAENSIGTTQILDASITMDKLSDTVKSKFITPSSVGTLELKESSVTLNKLAQDVIERINLSLSNVNDATTANKGVVQLATDNEVLNDKSSTHVITVSNLIAKVSQIYTKITSWFKTKPSNIYKKEINVTTMPLRLEDDIVCYKVDSTSFDTISFDTSLLSQTDYVRAWEVRLLLPTVKNITWGNIKWLNGENPDLSTAGEYIFLFRLYPNDIITSKLIGSLQGKII